VDLSAVPQGWLVLALFAVSALAVAQAAAAWLTRLLRRRRILSRVSRAGDGEREAARYLQDTGFTILGTQVASTYTLTVDDAPMAIDVRADLVVEKGARRFVVEVKTGKVAPRLDTPATRRQLLEYQLAFEVDGVLLFDAEARALRTVTFPDARPPRGTSGWLVLVLALLAAGLAFLLSR
jgi:hypothetical protein